jgi:hypothetical protein
LTETRGSDIDSLEGPIMTQVRRVLVVGTIAIRTMVEEVLVGGGFRCRHRRRQHHGAAKIGATRYDLAIDLMLPDGWRCTTSA